MLTHHDLHGLGLERVLAMLEKDKVGHYAVMDYLHIESCDEIVATMHFNDRQMPGARSMPMRRETLELLKQITRPAVKKDAAGIEEKQADRAGEE